MPIFCSRKITRKSTAVGVVFALHWSHEQRFARISVFFEWSVRHRFAIAMNSSRPYKCSPRKTNTAHCVFCLLVERVRRQIAVDLRAILRKTGGKCIPYSTDPPPTEVVDFAEKSRKDAARWRV